MPDDIEHIQAALGEIRSSIASLSKEVSSVRDNTKSARREADSVRDKLKQGDLFKNLNRVRDDLNRGVQTALQGLILERRSFKEVAGNFATNFFQGLVRRSQNINPFSRITPFAQGGVLQQPTFFPLGPGNTGLAGERGAEAILPLTRTADGNLGVQATGGQSVQINIQTPNPQHFFQSQTQLSSMLRRAVIRGGRNR